MQRNSFPGSRDREHDPFHGLPHCRDHSIEYGSCKMINKGCKYFHKGIDCIQQFRYRDCSGGCRYEHRDIYDDKHGDRNLKRKADEVDSRSSRDDKDRRDHRDSSRDGRDPRDSRDGRERDRDSGRDAPRDPASRDLRDSRESRDSRATPRDPRYSRDSGRDSTKDSRDTRTNPKESARDPIKDSRDSRDAPRDSRDTARDARDPIKDSRDTRDTLRDSRDGLRDPPRDSKDVPKDLRETGRDLRDPPRDSRDVPRDARDPNRDPRDSRDTARDLRDPPRDAPRDLRDPPRDLREASRDPPRDLRDLRDIPRDSRDVPRDSRDPNRDPRDSRDTPRELRDPPRDTPRDLRDPPRDAPRDGGRDQRDVPRDSHNPPRDLIRDPRDLRDTLPRDLRDSHNPSRDPIRDSRDAQRDARDPREAHRDPIRDSRDPRDMPRDTRDLRDLPRDIHNPPRDSRDPRDAPRDTRPGSARDPRDAQRETEDLERARESGSKAPPSLRDSDLRARDLERPDDSKANKKMKLDSEEADRLMPPSRDDRPFPPKRPFDNMRDNRDNGPPAMGHDIFIPSGARNPRGDNFPRDRDLGRDPRDFRDGPRPFYPDDQPYHNKMQGGHNPDRPLPNYNNFPPDRDRGLVPRGDRRFDNQFSQFPRDRPMDRRFDNIGERDRYVSDFPDDRNRGSMIDDPYRIRRDHEDLRGAPQTRPDFNNRVGMRMQNDGLHRGNDYRANRDLPPIIRDGPRMSQEYDVNGRQMFNKFRERVDMKPGIGDSRDSWQPPRTAGMDMHKVRDDFRARANTFNNLPPHADMRMNKQVLRPFEERNIPIRGDFPRSDMGRPANPLQERLAARFGNNAPMVHPFASRVHSFAERNNIDPNIEEKRRELRNVLPSANFARNIRDGQDPHDRALIGDNVQNQRGNWQERSGLFNNQANRGDNDSMNVEGSNSQANKDVDMQGDEKDKNQEQGAGDDERKEEEENPEAQRWNNVRQVLSKLNIFPSLAGNELYEHITQIKKESCQVKEQANNKIIAERTLAAKIMKEATGGDTPEEDFSSSKTDLGLSAEKATDEVDGEENMDYIENGERLFDEYYYNLQQIQNIPNVTPT